MHAAYINIYGEERTLSIPFYGEPQSVIPFFAQFLWKNESVFYLQDQWNNKTFEQTSSEHIANLINFDANFIPKKPTWLYQIIGNRISILYADENSVFKNIDISIMTKRKNAPSLHLLASMRELFEHGYSF